LFLDDICVFDFETSGLDHKNDRVIEMAAIRVRYGEVVSEFSTIVKQDIEITSEITRITGITQDQVEKGLNEDTAFKILRIIMGNALLVAHNAAFDLQFLHWSMMRVAGKTFNNPFIDTMTISRDRTTYPHKLIDMCEKYGVELSGAHRALNDVHGAHDLLKALHAEQPVDEWVNRLGYLSKYPAPEWVPEYATVFPTANKYERRVAN